MPRPRASEWMTDRTGWLSVFVAAGWLGGSRRTSRKHACPPTASDTFFTHAAIRCDFDGKIRSKLTTTLGLFVAINDFTDGAIETHSRVGAAMILMGGEDLYAILEGRYALPEVLHRKRRHASQTGDIYIRVRDF